MLQGALQIFAEPALRAFSKLFGGWKNVPLASTDEYPAHLVSLLTESGVPIEPLRHVRAVLITASECLQDVEVRAEGRRKAEVDGRRLAAIHKQIQQWRYRTIPEPTRIFGEFGWAAIRASLKAFRLSAWLKVMMPVESFFSVDMSAI